MRIIFIFCYLLCVSGIAQSIPAAQQKALNNYVAYANQSAEEINAFVASIIEFYPYIADAKQGSYYNGYSYKIQLEGFYLNKALQDSKALNAEAISLNNKVKALSLAAQKLDDNGKALDTYYKLEDFKQDNYAKAEALINALPALLMDYRQKQIALQDELESVYQKLNKYVSTNAYHHSNLMMRQQIKKEQSLIDAWTFNLNADVHTGWPVDKLEQSITETDQQIKLLESANLALKYPASSMYTSFKGSLGSILENKRSGLDGYNFEAKKSDKHSNAVYLDLINYFNGALVADYNTFIEFAERDGYYGLKYLTAIPVVEIRETTKEIVIEVQPFQDIVRTPMVVTKQKSILSRSSFVALSNYVAFINESLRQISYLQQVVSNLNASAAYYKDLTSFKGKGGLHYDYKSYLIPLSLYQETQAESKSIPSFAKPLNDQAQVLLNILKELDQLSASMEAETNEKRYEKDNLKKLYELLQRSKVLFETFDLKKEQLYNDVNMIYESYPIVKADNAWYIAGTALKKLLNYDHDALFKAKEYYKGNTSITINTNNIDQTLRDVITNEYANMKGIERLGRYNGLCPYSPYEDLPQTSKILSEKLNKLKPATKSGYSHPYHELVYQYNDAVEDYNKFCELSKEIMLLKIVTQPELIFETDKVVQSEPKKSNADVVNADEQMIVKKPVVKTESKAVLPDVKVIHDTVVVHQRDTIYMNDPDGATRSMEGYATNNMVLLLDVSGSMNTPEKLPLLKKSVLDLLSMMRPEDKVSIVVYSGKAKVLLTPTSFKEEGKIKTAIEKLSSAGKTDGNAGLKLAFKVADENYIRGGNNRIVLATDGEFPISDETFQLIDKSAKADIFISVFNFGKSNAAAKNLNKLATIGKGNYEFITKDNVEYKLIREVKAKRR